MSNFTIYKASAGSGKTFQLTRQFLTLVLRAEDNYAKILAVTFTNKAAGELKERVLSELFWMGSGEVKKSQHFEYLSDLLKRDSSVLVPRARKILIRILHDYSHFTIGTIDEFFQSILRSFTRELGLFSTYQLELGADRVLEEATASLIRKVSHDKELFQWILTAVEQIVADGKPWRRFERDLIRMGKELLREELSSWIVQNQQIGFNWDELKAFKQDLEEKIAKVKEALAEIGLQSQELLSLHGLSVDDFKGKSKGAAGYLCNLSFEKADPKKKRDLLNEPELWLTKTVKTATRASALAAIDGGLNLLLKNAIDLFDGPYHEALLSEKIKKSIHSLGLTRLLTNEIIEFSKQENIFLLALTNPIIAQLIADNPAPFIYEKTGKYYEHFMIDEFQDTSNLQWNNFKPLMQDSVASGGKSLVVGDAKQSIYRWRNSNWQLLNSKVEHEMNHLGVENKGLTTNFRSAQSVVDFNNVFFPKAESLLKIHLERQMLELGTQPIELLQSFSNVYSDVKQYFGNRRTDGFVDFHFSTAPEKNDFPGYFDRLIDLVDDLQQNKGYKAADIVFLTRKKSDASLLIRFFEQEARQRKSMSKSNFSVVSSESLRLDSSPHLRTLMAALHWYMEPTQKSRVKLFALEYLSCQSKHLEPQDLVSIAQLSTETLFDLPGLNNLRAQLKDKMPVNELIELILSEIGIKESRTATPFILSFKEAFRVKFNQASLVDVEDCLSWWEEEGGAISVSMDDEVDAMRVMTIHKAKGLEFPVVIIPECDWAMDHSAFNRPLLWVSTKGTAFSAIPKIPVEYESGLVKGPFSKQYLEEKIQIYLDNLNLLYVAFTRAAERLHVFVPFDHRVSLSRVNGLLFDAMQPEQEEEGFTYTFGDKDTSKVADGKLAKTSTELFEIPFEKLREEEGSYTSEAIKRGKLIHHLMEGVKTMDDLGSQIALFVEKSILKESMANELESQIRHLLTDPRIASLYSAADHKSYAERGLLVPGKGQLVPDRVIENEKGVFVLDYKTGKKEAKHKSQIKGYMDTLKKMGYANPKGYLLYFDEGDLVEFV